MQTFFTSEIAILAFRMPELKLKSSMDSNVGGDRNVVKRIHFTLQQAMLGKRERIFVVACECLHCLQIP